MEFITVPRRWRGSTATAVAGSSHGGTGGQASPERGGGGRAARACDAANLRDGEAEPAPAARGGEEDRADGGFADSGAQEEDGAEEQYDPWKELQKEREGLKQLRKQWGEDHWTVRLAQQRVDAAEQHWQSERPATRPSRLLQRAEQTVRKLEERADNIVSKLRSLDEEYNRKRDALEADLLGERTKLREARGRLVEVQAQVGAEACRGSGGAAPQGADRQVLASSVDALQQLVAPQLAAVAEAVEVAGVDDGVKQQLHQVMASLSSVHGSMQQHIAVPEHRHAGRFDIGDGEESLPSLDDADWARHAAAEPRDGQGWGYCWNGHVAYQRGGGYNGYNGYASHRHDYGASAWHGGYADGGQQAGHWYWSAADDGEEQERGSKRGKCGTHAAYEYDPMEEQRFEDMVVPTGGDGGSATAANAEAGAAAAAATTASAAGSAGGVADVGGETPMDRTARMDAMVAKFRRAATERGVDVSDVDVGATTAEQLQRIADERFGAASSSWW